MTREIITLQAGQCGNQIGMEFWKTLCSEHGIGRDGLLLSQNQNFDDRKDVFFYQADDTRFVPRSIMVDLEPRVINNIKAGDYKNLFNFESFLLSEEGGGAANNWVQGYDHAQIVRDDLIDMIDREAEGSDSLEAFILTHSIAGGTGSGLGSNLLEYLSDHYPKKLIKTYSVFPNVNGANVVVEPYNSVLSLKRLVQNSDCTTVLDNSALEKIVHNTLKTEDTNFDVINKLVSIVMSSATSTLRFPGFTSYDMVGLISPLMALPTCHFLTTSYTPFTRPSTTTSNIHRATVSETIRRLCSSKNKLVSSPSLSAMKNMHNTSSSYLSILNIMQGEFNLEEAYSSFNRMKELNKITYAPWSMDAVHVVPANKSPHITEKHKLSGLMMANNTSIKYVLKKIQTDFTTLKNRKAYMESYKKSSSFPNIMDEFEDSKEVVQNVIDDYTSCESADFLNFDCEF